MRQHFVQPSSGSQADWNRNTASAVNTFLQQESIKGLPLDPADFGVTEGDDAAKGAANNTAITALLAELESNAVNAANNAQGLHEIRFGRGVYHFASPIDITEGTVRITGMGWGQGDDENAASSTRLVFTDCTGIRLQHKNTSGASTKDGTLHVGAIRSSLADLAIEGTFDGTEADHHGVHARASFTARNVSVRNFAGEGFRVEGDSSTIGGSANLVYLQNCEAQACRTGLYIDGDNGNAGTTINCDFSENRQWGTWDSSDLGNTHISTHFNANGTTAYNDGSTIGVSVVTYNGFRYYCILGQSSGASTNAPSGTDTDNTWWATMGAGGLGTGIPVWTSGLLIREGGSFYSDELTSKNTLLNPYAEGNQGFIQLNGNDLLINGQINGANGGVRIRATAAEEFAVNAENTIIESGNFKALGATNRLGPESGTATNNIAYVQTTNTRSDVIFRSWSGGVSQNDALIRSTRGSYLRFDSLASGHEFQVAGTTEVTIDAGGINLASGNTYEINGTQVVGARGAAVADATDAASAITQLNALLARCRAHGLIAT